MLYFLEELLAERGGLTVALIATGAATAVFGGVSTLTSIVWSKAGPPVRIVLSAATSIAFAGFLGALVLLAGGARERLVEAIVHRGDSWDAATRIALETSVHLNGLWLGALLACFAAPAAIYGVALPWGLAPGRSAHRGTLFVVAGASGLVLLVAAIACVLYAGDLIFGFGAVANADAATKADLVRTMLEEASAKLSIARLFAVGAAAVAAAIALVVCVRAARAGAVVRAPALAMSGLVFAVGAGAFALTRGMAHDAEHPIVPSAALSLFWPEELEPPVLSRCEEAPVMPIVVVNGDRTTLDHRRMTPELMAQDLETLRRNWDVLHPYERFSDKVALVADRSATSASIAPWLRAIQAAEYSRVSIVTRRTSTVETRTLGGLERHSMCFASFVLDESGRPLREFPRWSHLASAAAEGGLIVAP
jgi:hypothetical protein